MKAKLREFRNSLYICHESAYENAAAMEFDDSPKLAMFYRGEHNAHANALMEFERIFKEELNDDT